jgi:hypothetical protein
MNQLRLEFHSFHGWRVMSGIETLTGWHRHMDSALEKAAAIVTARARDKASTSYTGSVSLTIDLVPHAD